MEKIKDQNGNEHNVISMLNIKGKDYHITMDKEVYVKDEDGNFVKFEFRNSKPQEEKDEAAEFLNTILQPPKSLDVIKQDYDREFE